MKVAKVAKCSERAKYKKEEKRKEKTTYEMYTNSDTVELQSLFAEIDIENGGQCFGCGIFFR